MLFRRTTISLVILSMAVLAASSGCGNSGREIPQASIATPAAAPNASHHDEDTEPVQLTGLDQAGLPPTQTPTAAPVEVLITTSLGDIRLRLDRGRAPRSVENFLYNYVERGFYDGTIFHYVEPGYMLAAGGYNAQYEYLETRTPILCEANNGLKNRKGTVGMAHHPDHVHSATSQFYINLADNPGLDYQATDGEEINGYCVFGEVVEGQDVVEQIAGVAVHDQGEFVKTPVEPVVIESVRRIR